MYTVPQLSRILYLWILIIYTSNIHQTYLIHVHGYTITTSSNIYQKYKTKIQMNLNNDMSNTLQYIQKKQSLIPPFQSLSLQEMQSLCIKELEGGNTNYNYVVYQKDSNKKCFVKHAKPYAKGFGESVPMSTKRLEYEFEGMNEFSKYGFLTPECYSYDPIENYLISSYLDGYEPFLKQLQSFIIDIEIPQSMGAILGHCHAGTYKGVIPIEISNKYQEKYQNTEHFQLWDEHFFPMSLLRLSNPELFIQSENIANFGNDHYDNVKRYLINEIGQDGMLKLSESILKVKDYYLNKKTTLIHADLHCNNIMVKKQLSDDSIACDLSKLRLIDFEKFAYGWPGLDIAQFLTNYIYFMPFASLIDKLHHTNKYYEIEIALCEFIESYIEAFEIHSEKECQLHNLCMLPEIRYEVMIEIFNDAIGFMGWWMFSLVASCPVDVIPLLSNDDLENSNSIPVLSKQQINEIRLKQLKVAIACLTIFHENKKFTNLQEFLDILRETILD